MSDLRGDLIRTDHRDRGPVDRPLAALDLHLDQLRWLGTERGQHWADTWWGHYGDRQTRNTAQQQRLAQTNWEGEQRFLNRALTLHLQPDMADLLAGLTEADEGRPPEPLRATDPWAPAGLAFLPPGHEQIYYPIRNLDGGSELVVEPMTARAIGWDLRDDIGRISYLDGVATANPGPGIQVWVYGVPAQLFGVLNQQAEWVGDEPFPDVHSLVTVAGPLPLLDSTGWAMDAEWRTRPDDADATGVDVDGTVVISAWVGSVRRWVKRLWRLLDEQIVAADPWRPPRAAARRMTRLAPRRLDGDVVRILRLRRIADADTGEQLTGPALVGRFTHSWRVRSHWRHLRRGQGYLDDDGVTLLLDADYRWADADITLALTDAEGYTERAVIDGRVVDGLARLRWPVTLRGVVEVERLALIPEHTAGLGLLIERFDIASVQR